MCGSFWEGRDGGQERKRCNQASRLFSLRNGTLDYSRCRDALWMSEIRTGRRMRANARILKPFHKMGTKCAQFRSSAKVSAAVRADAAKIRERENRKSGGCGSRLLRTAPAKCALVSVCVCVREIVSADLRGACGFTALRSCHRNELSIAAAAAAASGLWRSVRASLSVSVCVLCWAGLRGAVTPPLLPGLQGLCVCVRC